MACLQKEMVIAVSLKGGTAWDINVEPFAICLPLARKCKQRVTHLKAMCSALTCDEKKNVLPCVPRTLQKWMFCRPGNDARFGNP